MFPTDLTAALTGASRAQLRRWNRIDLLTPEVADRPRLMYSFRDVVALRTVVRLRSNTSLQKVRRAFNSLPTFDLTEHPSKYRFGTDGETIVVEDDDDNLIDLVRSPGQYHFVSLADVFAPFVNQRGENVVDFLHPRERLEVRAARMGGWPTIVDTRIPYDTVADLVSTGEVPLDRVDYYYPGVDAEAAREALDFRNAVRGVA
jgi:uncharacterized protein (DUF433 family)